MVADADAEVKMKKSILGVLIVLGLVLAGCTSAPTGNVVKNSKGGYIEIPVSEITNEMQKFAFNANGVNVKYIVVKDKNGVIRTAFDACDVCGGYKGYSQKGDDVVCNNCGRAFEIESLGTKNVRGGGCWPSFLDHKIESKNILISKSELQKGAFRFK